MRTLELTNGIRQNEQGLLSDQERLDLANKLRQKAAAVGAVRQKAAKRVDETLKLGGDEIGRRLELEEEGRLDAERSAELAIALQNLAAQMDAELHELRNQVRERVDGALPKPKPQNPTRSPTAPESPSTPMPAPPSPPESIAA